MAIHRHLLLESGSHLLLQDGQYLELSGGRRRLTGLLASTMESPRAALNRAEGSGSSILRRL